MRVDTLTQNENSAIPLSSSKDRGPMASKYAPLTECLRSRAEPVVELNFDELDELVGGMPASARRHPAWWANSRTAHNHARAWLDAERQASPRFNEGYVRFAWVSEPRTEDQPSDATVKARSETRSGSTVAPPRTTMPLTRDGGLARRIGLVGCVKDKAAIARPARDLYQSPLFQGRRRYVEQSCTEWWILSALHGLVGPDEVLEPYDVTLNGASVRVRRRWSDQVLNQITSRIQPDPSDSFELHAGINYRAFGLEDGLCHLGCGVECPTDGLRMGEQLSYYSRARWT